jgi:hypothetical protein
MPNRDFIARCWALIGWLSQYDLAGRTLVPRFPASRSMRGAILPD